MPQGATDGGEAMSKEGLYASKSHGWFSFSVLTER